MGLEKTGDDAEALKGIPTKYRGLDSETLEIMWQPPLLRDDEKNQAVQESRHRALAALRAQEERARATQSNTDQHAANTIRQELGVQLTPEPLQEADVQKLQAEAWKRAKGNNDVNLDMMLTTIDWQIGQHFDAHGIAKISITDQLRQLITLLEKGIDPNRPFHTAPLEVNPNLKAQVGAGLGTAGGTSRNDGSFIILGDVDRPLKKGIRYVIVNDAYYEGVDRLQRAFPLITFMRADQANDRLREIIDRKTTTKE